MFLLKEQSRSVNYMKEQAAFCRNCRSGGFERQSYFDFNPWSGHDSFVEPDKRKYADKKIFGNIKVPKNCAVSVVEIKGKDIIIKEEGLIYY